MNGDFKFLLCYAESSFPCTLLKQLTTDRWGAVSTVGGERGETQSLSPLPVPRSEIYLSYHWAGRRTLAWKFLQPTIST
eukprot:1045814-Rhodomonas_salina.1